MLQKNCLLHVADMSYLSIVVQKRLFLPLGTNCGYQYILGIQSFHLHVLWHASAVSRSQACWKWYQDLPTISAGVKPSRSATLLKNVTCVKFCIVLSHKEGQVIWSFYLKWQYSGALPYGDPVYMNTLLFSATLFQPEQKLSESFSHLKNPFYCGPFVTGLMGTFHCTV